MDFSEESLGKKSCILNSAWKNIKAIPLSIFKNIQNNGDFFMDIPTSIIEISGTLMIRIPKEMVNELGITKNMKVSAVDVNKKLIELQFRD